MRSLLDTQILIWLLLESGRIKPSLKSLLDQGDNLIYVSCLSFYEIEQKRGLGKRKFDYDFKSLIEGGYFEVIDSAIEHIYQIRHLPLIHGDPFDRLMIAQSIVEGIPMITADRQIQKYNFPHVKA